MKKIHLISLIALTALFTSPIFADTVANTNGNMSHSTIAAPTDDSLTTEVKTKMDQDATLKGLNITVSTQDGVVTLNGNVKTQVEANSAIAAAKSVPGVKDVKSNMSVNNDISNTENTDTSNLSY